MRGWRALAVLVAIAAAVGALLWWDRGRPSTDDARAARARLAPGFERARAFAITIERGGEKTRLERADDGWWLTEPRRRADDDAVEQILGELEFGQVERRLYPDAAGRARMGLDAPRATITVGDWTARVGGDAPGGHAVYVARGGEREALVVERRLLEVIDRARDGFVSKRLAVGAVGGVRQFGAGAVLIKREPRGWRLTQPFRMAADDKRVEAWLAALDGARATRVIDPVPVQNGVAIQLDGDVEAALGPACPQHPLERVVLRSDGACLCFDDATLARLTPEPRDLVDARLVPLDVERVTRVTLEGPHELALERAAGEWRIVEPASAAGPADDAAVREWLASLAAARASGFESMSHQRLARLGLHTPDGLTLIALERDGERLFVYREGDSHRQAIDASARALFEVDAARFRPRRVLNFAAGDVERIRVEEGGVVEEAARAADGGFRIVRPAALDADAEIVARTIDALAGLRADRFVPGAALRPARTLTVELRAGDGGAREAPSPSPSIELSAPALDGCLARVARAPIFHLPPETCAELNAHLATRRLFDVRADRLRAIAIERGAERFSAERRGGAWQANGAPVPAARIDALVERLRALTADSVEGYGNLPQAVQTVLRLSTEGAADQQLDVAAPSGGTARARLHGGRALYRVPAAAVDALVTAALR
ncbi:MAG TPA: DUF4340 domain-containing protein [Polyangia bacterium]|nr:DUF4340 domain-containing protein [Polyangia bacterium]